MLISATLLIYFFTALSASFLCSLLEAILLSTTPSFVKSLADSGHASGKRLQHLKDRIDRPLIAILTLNTVANMFGSAGVGAETSRLAREAGVSDTLPVGIAAGALTLAILICSEIIPKTLGATYWRPLAGPASGLIAVLCVVLSPLISALEFLPRLISKRGTPSAVTREEVLSLAELGRSTGGIPHRESELIANLLRLNLLRVHDAMTPRVEVVAFDETLTAEEAFARSADRSFSRIPVFSETIDRVTGYVDRHDLALAAAQGRGSTLLSEMKHAVRIVPETKSIASMLDELIRHGEHLFLVVNEYGGTEGVITMKDVIDTLLGIEIAEDVTGVEDLRRIAIERLKEGRAGLASKDQALG